MKKSVIQLHEIQIVKNKVFYKYTYSPNLDIYFKNCDDLFISYDFDVKDIPKSILAIPWLSNFMTIAWFTGSTIIVDEMDSEFVECLSILKKGFATTYPEILSKKSDLIVHNLVKNNYQENKEAMLFSGGLDAWTTFLKHKDKKFDLITILGSDIELHDVKKVELIKASYNENPLLAELKAHFISCNFRNFYNRKIERLIYFNFVDWWTLVQHGLALTGATAPLAYFYGFSKVFIASSFSENERFLWGSSGFDNDIKFGNTNIIHDGREFNRIGKTEFVVNQLEDLKLEFPLRVCYKHNFSDFNCSSCPKCLRMIISLIFNNKNPNDFGFQVNSTIYDVLINQLKSNRFTFADSIFWTEIVVKIKSSVLFYVFENQEIEKEKIQLVLALLNKNKRNYPSQILKFKKNKNDLRNKWHLIKGNYKNK
jgi:hypothetical protein